MGHDPEENSRDVIHNSEWVLKGFTENRAHAVYGIGMDIFHVKWRNRGHRETFGKNTWLGAKVMHTIRERR